MSTLGSYPRKEFNESLELYSYSPSTQQAALVPGSSLVEFLALDGEVVLAISTTDVAVTEDLKQGAIIYTSGGSSVGDGANGTYVVVPAGEGDIAMTNGMELKLLPAGTLAGSDASGALVTYGGTTETIASALTGTISKASYADSIFDLLSVDTAALDDGQQFSITGYLPDTATGGGLLYYDASRVKSDHNGITVISPTVPWDGTLAALPSFRAGTGETDAAGTGVFVRLTPRIFSDQDSGYSGASNILSAEAVSDDGVFYQRASAQDGLLTASKTLTAGSEHVFDIEGRAFKAADNRGINLTQHGVADIPRLSGQIAQNVETFVTDGDRVYVLAKGSYSLNDSSMLASYQIGKNGIDSLSFTVDLGTGADCRAMTIANGYLYIFKGANILVFKTEDYAPPALVYTVPRSSGFVQTCSVINGLLVAPVWGAGRIDTYSINDRGYPVLHEEFTVTAGSSNSSVVDAGDGSYLLIRHVSGTDALGRFHFNAEKKITGMQYFSIPEMLQCRYGVVRDSHLYTGSFSTGSLVEVFLSPQTPSLQRTFENMGTFVVYDNYIIGAKGSTNSGGANSATNLSSGTTYPLSTGLEWIYPQLYSDTFITFINGDEPPATGAASNDSPLGQKIAVYKLKNNADLEYPPSPAVPSYKSVSTVINTESSYEINGVVAGFNSMGTVKQLDSQGFSWLELKASGVIVDDQGNGASNYKVFEGRALLLYSGGTWTVKQAYADDISKGTSGVTFQLSAGSGLAFGVNALSAASGLIARVKIEIRTQDTKALSL